MNTTAQSQDFESVRARLKVKHQAISSDFADKYPKAHAFLKERGVDLGKIREHSAKILGTSALTGSLILSSPAIGGTFGAPLPIVRESDYAKDGLNSDIPGQKQLVDALDALLPAKTGALDRTTEKALEKTLTDITGIPARASLEGEHLNTTYGLIGAEQHLPRYPGDSIVEHGEGKIRDVGLTPGKGAWGYFAQSRAALTPSLVETEKWYAVVQTLYLPDWSKRVGYLRDWYKYRKVLIVNTQNGNAVVAAIADSGPAAWTGKHFGGSPEVMDYLGGWRYKKGAVLVFFVDDPNNKIPLGPVDYNKVGIPTEMLKEI